eukprot:CAMPEP_0117672430 /NCGR_PEP_ID=MMETSP0804-20121206/13901_1 /TAXON_ID=1074897 /ORGANISM="Tetraselmis astigmatica, Strain CCMP880" /LENGTH=581 /DNA_ID=CAMNT_0005481033 /DNA_START=737 /DNA_END=2480 /DNA_ORIENTATION=+
MAVPPPFLLLLLLLLLPLLPPPVAASKAEGKAALARKAAAGPGVARRPREAAAAAAAHHHLAKGGRDVDEHKVMAQLCACALHNQTWAESQTPSGSDNDSNDSQQLDYDGYIGIELRGHSSQRHDKKSWAIELRDQNGEDVEHPLFGMPSDDDWVLLGAETDQSLGLRNYMAYSLYRSAMGRYAPRVMFVEVLVLQEPSTPPASGSSSSSQNGTAQNEAYRGLYLLGEKVKSTSDRLDISDFDEDSDRSGGYILKYDNDNIDEGDHVLKSSATGLQFIMYEPKKGDGLEAAQAWITDWLSGLEGELQSLRPSDSLSSLSHCIDLPAFVDYFLITELSKNPDGYRGSVYMHKDRGGCLRMGPPWDYNEAFGLCCGFPIEGYQSGGGVGNAPEGWRFNICKTEGMCKFDPVDGISWWFQKAWTSAGFQAKAAARWRQLRQHQLSDAAVLGKFDSAAGLIFDAAERNNERWAASTAQEGFESGLDQWVYHTMQMRAWLAARLQWMDKALHAVGKRASAGGIQAQAAGSANLPRTAKPTRMHPLAPRDSHGLWWASGLPCSLSSVQAHMTDCSLRALVLCRQTRS